MFYATWIEHRLNDMILLACDRHNLSEANARQVIRESNLHTKTGSLWNLLYADSFPEHLKVRVLSLAQERNAFVHYKWESQPEHAHDETDKRIEQLSVTSSELIKDLTELENRLVYLGRRNDLLEALELVVNKNFESGLKAPGAS